VLQHHPELDARAFRRLDRAQDTVRRDLQRLFDEHMLSGLRRPFHQLAVGVGRGEHHHRIDGFVGKDSAHLLDHREAPKLGKGLPARFARAVAGGYLDAAFKIEKALGMGRGCHAEADDRDAFFGQLLLLL